MLVARGDLCLVLFWAHFVDLAPLVVEVEKGSLDAPHGRYVSAVNTWLARKIWSVCGKVPVCTQSPHWRLWCDVLFAMVDEID